MRNIVMLETVGTGVAMGNAKDEVKARANTICKLVEDGLFLDGQRTVSLSAQQHIKNQKSV